MNTRTLVITSIVVLLLGAGGFTLYARTSHPVQPITTQSEVIATTTPEIVATTTVATTTPKAPVVTKVVKTVTVVKTPSPVVVPPVVILTPPPPVTVAGYGSLVASAIPLLSGGNARPGSIVAVSYLQINNTGTTTVRLTGFRLKENGSAPDVSIIGLQTVDEKGGSRGLVGGTEATTPFVNGITVATTNAILAPGEMKLFTIKVQLSATAGQYAGSQIIISVTGLEATATTRPTFPIAGTTWTITQ
ncbi:MAG: hypothetical protein ABIT47_03825 [Candidatus Paceibacterota bacterium]